jgi:hypothetical protein
MLTNSLDFLAVVLPTAFAFLVEILEDKHRQHRYWRKGVIALGFGISVLTVLQQWNARREAKADREAAVAQTITRTTQSVSDALKREYGPKVVALQGKVDDLTKKVEDQGRGVDEIRGSNIVTGKTPIRVELANPPIQPTTSTFANIGSQWSAVDSIYPDAQNCLKIVFTSTAVVDPLGLRVYFSDRVRRADLMSKFLHQGWVKVADGDLKQVEIAIFGFAGDVPLKPERPLIVNVCSDKEIRPVNFERVNVVRN